MMKKKELLIPIRLIVITILIGVKSDGQIVVDTDGGADDAMAILLLLTANAYYNDSYFNVEAITCVYGNSKLSDVEQNVLKTLSIANEIKIPVYSGASKPLTQNHTSDYFFGNDGFGDFEFDQEITSNIDRSKHAAVALIDLANTYPGELSIIVLGPTTNIALAISLDPTFVQKVKRFYVMGGSVSGYGNSRPGVEFNFGLDAESNFIFFNSTQEVDILLLPWEANLIIDIPMSWRTDVLGIIESKYMKFLNQAESKIRRTRTWQPCDSLIVAVMMWPNLITSSFLVNITPIMAGEARGGLLVDYAQATAKPKNVEVIDGIDIIEFQDILILYFS
ncbi:unnamed protein product [Macrosiphum euphorbiae]|uniref:Inosine/uridine-preferring nucleoside hydrolase domain-containing protein n=1 Tax=Macrosiphum euphorbiae TaxID=13131 RepID=A0AAV0WUZ5_9HEMI|nr:unnamed protein product [Macrosiphum euphorbiae]